MKKYKQIEKYKQYLDSIKTFKNEKYKMKN